MCLNSKKEKAWPKQKMQPQNPIQPNNEPQSNPSPVAGGELSSPQQGSLVNSGKIIQPLTNDLQPSAPANPMPQMQAAPTSPPVSQSVYPEPTAFQNAPATTPVDTHIGLTGSQMQKEKKPMPIGVYIIAGLNLIGFVIGFFDTSQNSGVYTIAMLLDLMLAIGLLLRLEVARKLIMWLSGLILALTVVSLIMLVGLQQRISQLKTNYDTAISRIDQSKLTPTQKQQLDEIQAAIAVKEKQAGKAISFTYIKLGVTGVEMLGVMIYLSRPKVKEVFHELES